MWKWLALGSAVYGIAAMLLVAAPPRTPLGPELSNAGGAERQGRHIRGEGQQRRQAREGDQAAAQDLSGAQDLSEAPRRERLAPGDDGQWPEGELRSAFDFEGGTLPAILTKPPTPFTPVAVPDRGNVLQWRPDPALPRNLLALGIHLTPSTQALHVDLRCELGAPAAAPGGPDAMGGLDQARRGPQVFVGVREHGGAIYGQRFPADALWQSHDLMLSELRLSQFTRDDNDQLDPEEVTSVVVALLHPRAADAASAVVELDNIAAH